MSSHLVIGYGPAGAATARLLAEQGYSVRVVTRSGGPKERSEQQDVEHLALDASDSRALTEAAKDAVAIYNCASPPYHRWTRDWPALAASVNAAAEETGAVLVILSNLYGYGPVEGPMTEGLPLVSTGRKGRVRAEVWQRALELHEQGRLRAVEVRASDFFGPEVTDGGHLSTRVVPPLLRGRTAQVMGDPDAPHSWTYVPDVARALVRVAGEESAWGRPWHVPTHEAMSARAMVRRMAEEAGVSSPSVRPLPPALLRALSLVSPLLRELQEVRYQFDRPFVVDSSAYTERFGEGPTPLDTQISETVRWWQERMAATTR